MSEEQLPGEEPKKNEQEGDFSSESTTESTGSPLTEGTAVPVEPTPIAQQGNGFPPNNGGFPPPNNGGFSPNNGGYGGMQQALPNATIVLVLGILSIVTCCCFYGILSLVLSIVALVLSKKDKLLYAENMGLYTEGSFKNLNAGRVCAIIGLILGALIIVMCIGIAVIFGFGVLNDQEAMKEIFQNMQ